METAARRLLSLSEELRAAKLEASGLRRHVSGLREDRRHLERKLSTAEAAARALEEAKVEAETRALLLADAADGGDGDGGGGGHLDDGGEEEDNCNDGGRSEGVEDVGVHGAAGGLGSSGSGGGAKSGRRGGRVREGAGGFSQPEQRLLVAAYALPAGAEADFGGLDPEETLRRLRASHAKVRAYDKRRGEDRG